MAGRSEIRLRPKQSLGQNFLIDDNIVRNIVRDLAVVHDDVIIEIGPGTGALTRALAGRARHLVLVEIDSRAVGLLREEFTQPEVTILQDDIRDIDFTSLSRRFKSKLRVVGNIPYHLTSPILFKIFEEHAVIRDLTIMIQREVARRIVASRGTKEYGILAVMTQLYGSAKSLFTVSPNCFYPKPKVTSAVIRVTIDERRVSGIDENLLRTVVKTAFGKRRKMLRNSLAYLPFDETIVDQLLGRMNLSPSTRPEQVSAEEFVNLTKLLQQIVGSPIPRVTT